MSSVKPEFNVMQEEVEFIPNYHEESLFEGEFGNSNDESLLRGLLHHFDMESLMPFLKAADVTYRSLRYLSVEDINVAIRSVGLRAEFREKLFAWRRSKFNSKEIINDCEQITDLTVDELPTLATLKKQKSKKRQRSPTPTEVIDSESETSPKYQLKRTNYSSAARGFSLQLHRKNLNLQTMLDQSHFGAQMKEFYRDHGFLERKHRDDIIQIIVNFVCVNGIQLHARDFVVLVDDIIEIFPNEAEAKDYYFIDRAGKRNPTGRLYTKYYNTRKRSKLKRCLTESANSICDYSNASASTPQENRRSSDQQQQQKPDDDADEEGGNSVTDAEVAALDEPSLNAIKSFLRCDGIDWDDVCTMWSKTYTARRDDAKRLSIKDFLYQWPKYLALKGTELFAIDFKWMYPLKSKLRADKWTHFKAKIYAYYQLNIKDDWCKGIFMLSKAKPAKIAEDYLLLILLNAILPPTVRFRDSTGRVCRKSSIVDACEWFAMRVSSLDKVAQRKQEIQRKYNVSNAELHNSPSIVVVGENNISIEEIYVCFETTMYVVPDFLSAIAVCMHIFHVLAIPYPPFNEFPWTFIQRYFYEIRLPEDAKCPSLISLCTNLMF